MIDVATMNHQLAECYARGWDALCEELSVVDGASRPFVVQVPEGYAECRRRLMIVGQETFGWSDGNDHRSWSLADGMKLYADFDMNHGRKPTPFWDAARELQRTLNPGAPERAFIWTNLGRVDLARGRPAPALEDRVASLGWFAEELRITSPDVVVFFTGPSYDARLRASIPDATMIERQRGLACVTGSGLPAHAYRSYHPRYLRMRKKWGYLNEITMLANGAQFGTGARALPSPSPTASQVR